MAVHASITGASIRAPFVPVPPAAITRVLSRFDREQLASFITVAIDLLDVADGDPDVEANGDELDCTGSAEEDTPLYACGAGDGAAGDPDDAEDDDPAGDPLDEYGEAPTDDGSEVMFTKPIYAVDQSRGPTNETAGYRAWQEALHAD